jgi:hypothetical protein
MRKMIGRSFGVYRSVTTIERINGRTVVMYGIEGKNQNEKITIKSLSEDKSRLDNLVRVLNNGGFELCHLNDTVNDFLFETYGISLK